MEQTISQTKTIEEVLLKRPLIISGPCSAETEDQVLQTAIRLAATGKVDVLMPVSISLSPVLLLPG